MVLTTISSQSLSAAFASSSDAGFQDGLSDCQTGTSNAINGHSNAGHHSAAYMDAYNRGLTSCNNLNNNSQPNTQSDTAGKQLLCLAAGGVILLGGVPAPAVMAAGQQAHNAGICP